MAASANTTTSKVDWDAVERDYRAGILSLREIASNQGLVGNEADVVRAFLVTHAAGRYDETIPCGPTDTVVTEMVFKFGRADIVVFHVDGTASVIEAKDGSRGYTHVVSGIGQAALYATQLEMAKGAVRFVRKCLMWSSTGDAWLDALICTACESANVIPMPMPDARELKAAEVTSIKAVLVGAAE